MPLTFFRQITQDPPGYEEEPKPSTSKDASGTIPHAPPRSQIRFEKEVVNFPKGRDLYIAKSETMPKPKFKMGKLCHGSYSKFDEY